MIVLDSNVVSELMRPEQEPAVIRWLDRQPVTSIWIISVTFIEIRYGLLILPEGRRRRTMMTAFEWIVDGILQNRVLPFDRLAADCSAHVAARRRLTGRAVATNDTQIAGIVMSRNAKLATRNVKDFEDLDIALVDPWLA